MAALKFSVNIKEQQDKLPTMYWIPTLHKRPYKARITANSSSCTTTKFLKLLISCLTAIKTHVIRYCEKKITNIRQEFDLVNSSEVLNKLKSRRFCTSSLSANDFFLHFVQLCPHNFIKEKLAYLIESTFQREGSSHLACNDRNAFFTSED